MPRTKTVKIEDLAKHLSSSTSSNRFGTDTSSLTLEDKDKIEPMKLTIPSNTDNVLKTMNRKPTLQVLDFKDIEQQTPDVKQIESPQSPAIS